MHNKLPGDIKRDHTLKTWPEYFQPVADGLKWFEIRKNDRDFKVGDILLLQEWNNVTQLYTGRYMSVRVDYMTDFGQPEGQVVMSIAPILGEVQVKI
jgi:hypothetical protein